MAERIRKHLQPDTFSIYPKQIKLFFQFFFTTKQDWRGKVIIFVLLKFYSVFRACFGETFSLTLDSDKIGLYIARSHRPFSPR